MYDSKIKQLTEIYLKHYPGENHDKIINAFEYITNSDYSVFQINTALNTACRTASMGLDQDVITAALLYVEDAPPENYEEEIKRFGETVEFLIKNLSSFKLIDPQYIKPKEFEKYRKMVLALAGDLRVVLIILSYYSELMKNIEELPGKRRDETAFLVKNIYASIANRMGLQLIKSEMENAAFRYFEPEKFEELKEALRKIEESRKEYVNEVIEDIKSNLEKHGVSAVVYGRSKHIFSIWQKMKSKNKTLEEIHDIMGFRIIVKDRISCYSSLGIIHDAYKPIVGRFKDYIAVPKPNGYQSLHTTVIGPGDKKIEIQIRTEEMHEIAEKGVAAHWLYKEKRKSSGDSDENKFKDLRDKKDILKNGNSNFWSLESFRNEIFVFTPQHNLVVLPRGATALDFAFAVHTQVGMHCIGAKVDGSIVPLKHELQTGNTVEITTSSKRFPNADWLNFVITSKARNKIKNFIRQNEREEARKSGKETLEKELKKHKISFSKLSKDGTLEDIASEFRFQSIPEMFLAIGEGKLDVSKIIKFLVPDEDKQIEIIETKRKKKQKKISGPPVEVDGLRNVVIRFAKCCNPIPGDEIEGFVTRGRGVTIHRKGCPKLAELEKERFINVKWISDYTTGEPYLLKVISENKPGLLAAMSEVMAKNAINIQKLYTENLRKNRIATFFYFSATKEMTDKVAKNMRKLRFINNVIKIKLEK